ncbi:MAG TPA: hypothetical protein DHW82_13150 [Spirochaetia bacterium]|nr:hypothetical protein [Spirochaetia bacterium]
MHAEKLFSQTLFPFWKWVSKSNHFKHENKKQTDGIVLSVLNSENTQKIAYESLTDPDSANLFIPRMEEMVFNESFLTVLYHLKQPENYRLGFYFSPEGEEILIVRFYQYFSNSDIEVDFFQEEKMLAKKKESEYSEWNIGLNEKQKYRFNLKIERKEVSFPVQINFFPSKFS